MATPHENQSSSSSVVVIMVPFLAQSHLNQLLQFAHVVSSSYDIPVHYVSTALHISQVKSRTSNPLHHLTKIHFHNIPTPPLPSSPPNPNAKTKSPEHQIATFKASRLLRQPVAALLQSLSPTAKRLVVVYDFLMASVVQDVVSLPNAESYSFNCTSAFSGFAFRCEALGLKNQIPIKKLPSAKSCCMPYVRNFGVFQVIMSYSKAGEIYNSCRAIEGSFIDKSTNDNISGEKKVWAVGPLHQTTLISNELREQDKCLLEWLDKQEPNSVLYISFGTTTTFSDEEIKELALGLEESGVKFIWALRDADKADIFSHEVGRRPQLPNGFEERMRGTGMVVREWVPQVKILEHPSTGGFMSHCGWNSCMESMSMGVPIAAWPMHSDQPMNALLITKLLKVGVAVIEWEQRNELVTSSMISKAVKKLMASDEGDEIRMRAKEMGEAINRSIVKEGDCHLEWNSFVAHITRAGSPHKNHKIRSFGLRLVNSLIEFFEPIIVLGLQWF